MAQETIFSKIIRREIPADILYQDELVTAFRDINPRAPTHILIIPNVLIPTANDVEAVHELALGRLFTVARKLAAEAGIAENFEVTKRRTKIVPQTAPTKIRTFLTLAIIEKPHLKIN